MNDMVDTVMKGSNQRIEASITTCNGQVYADIPTCCEHDAGRRRPTKMGVTVPRGLLGELKLAPATEPTIKAATRPTANKAGHGQARAGRGQEQVGYDDQDGGEDRQDGGHVVSSLPPANGKPVAGQPPPKFGQQLDFFLSDQPGTEG